MQNKFKFFRQLESLDCGPTCLKMISHFYGKTYTSDYLRKLCYADRSGVSLAGINEGAKSIGFNTIAAKLTYKQLTTEASLPCIIHWRSNHFVVVLAKQTKSNVFNSEKKEIIKIADPGFGIIKLHKDEFIENWHNSENEKGIALLLEPPTDFLNHPKPQIEKDKKRSLLFLFNYLLPYKSQLVQIMLGMLLAAGISLAFPLLAQQLIDFGIKNKSINFIFVFLVAQLALHVGLAVIEIIRSWSLLYLNTRINIKIISDFLIKLMKLPINYFDTKVMSDILLRIDDHSKIEDFLSSSSLNVLFSSIIFIAFSIFMLLFAPFIFLVFFIGSVISIIWILFFLRQRKIINYKKFELESNNRNSLYEIINGMEEIKLNNAERNKRFDWERIQVNLYKLNKQELKLQQTQFIGLNFITQVKNLVLTFIAALLVVNGKLSLGAMFSISYIVGQLNGPIEQLISFFHSAQDAKISVERLNDIYSKKDEEEILLEKTNAQKILKSSSDLKGSIIISDLFFDYNGPFSPKVFNNLNLTIPFGKITAIVGASGSGKTTLFKLLLKFYEPTKGNILIEQTNLNLISPDQWREKCGVVMQDGYIFSDTIAKNISLHDEIVNAEKLKYALHIANLTDFIHELPLKEKTKIGGSGVGLSIGQQQRILIARAIYKNPDILFFDEATSSLDANNEKIIMDNLNNVFHHKTVLIIAHRLSTVKNADQIVVLDKGKIVELGTHKSLSQKKGYYYELVKNQLDLGE